MYTRKRQKTIRELKSFPGLWMGDWDMDLECPQLIRDV